MSQGKFVSLQERWNWIEENRSRIVAALEDLASDLPREDRRFVNRLIRWFSGTAGFEKAVESPDVLAICIPLVENDNPPSDVTIRRAVTIGVCTIGRTLSLRNRLLSRLVYPLCQIILIIALTIFFSIWIIPMFEAFFLDIEIQLPMVPEAIINLASLVRAGWKYFVILALLLVGIGLAMNWIAAKRDVVRESWLRQVIETNRNKAACWTWHVAMLLESGVQVARAVEIAGESQVSRWLKTSSQKWVDRHSEKTAKAKEDKQHVFGQRYQMMDTTLSLSDSKAQTDLFREISTYYWERNRMISEWWISWATSLLFWFFVAGVILVAFSLYVPVYSSFSGLVGW